MHRSPYFGRSIEFRQHREYTYGDDPRYVDWKVWAKQDRYYVKQFEEDTNLRCALLCDVSNSMRYGRGAMNKYEYACTIAVSLAYLLLRQQDAVGCVAFDDSARMTVPMRTKRNHLDSIIQALERSSPRDKTGMYPVLRHAAESYPRRGLMVLVSDLLVPREGLFRGLRLLRSRGHDVMVFHVLDDDELDFPFSGPTRFEGLELAEQLRCNPRGSGRATCGRWATTWTKSAAAAPATTSITPCSAPASRSDAALAAYLHARSACAPEKSHLTRLRNRKRPCRLSCIQPCCGPSACRAWAWWRSPC